jgi:succinoglycan biosynthesis protein ExoA
LSTPVDVAMPVLNEAEALPSALQSIADQSRSVNRVWVADGGSTDGTRTILEKWTDRLPIEVLDNPRRRQAPGLNLILEQSDAPYLARMDGHTTWSANYLEVMVNVLETEPDLGAAGAPVHLHRDATLFQQNVWGFMCHVLGTGGPAYREPGGSPKDVPSLQAPVYRREALEAVGGFPEDLPWAEDDGLHMNLRRRGWDLRLEPSAELRYLPRNHFRGVFRQMYHYGRGRGELGRRGRFPSRRHRIIDRLLLTWTLGLVWNPIGWGFGLFYSLFLGVIVFKQWMEDKGGWPLLLLFPGGQVSYWFGWVSTRFRRDPDSVNLVDRRE